MTTDVQVSKTEGKSLDIEAADKEKLQSAFPQCFTEGKLDIDKLLSLCGEYIDNDFEKYKFEWKGKSECYRIAGKRSTGTLRPCPKESVNFDATNNLYIEGDNLEVLKLLQTAYYRKVKMIYIDPPYNTGHDFVYEDDFKDPMAKYKEITSQTTKSNPETMGRYHTNWLNMMYPRLRLAANLLRDDGVIFISIDDNEVTNLRKICDEVFGEENFVGQLILQTATDNNPRQISTEHEYILCYAKDLESQDFWYANSEKAQLIQIEYERLRDIYNTDIYSIQIELRKWIKENKNLLDKVSHYDNVDEKGVFHDGDIANTKFGGYIYDVIHPTTKKVCKIPEKGFRFPEQTMLSMIANNEIMFGEDEKTLMKPKKRLLNAKDILRTVIYEDGRASTKIVDALVGRGVFQNPKSNIILSRLINFTTSKDEHQIILDFFSGSATTAHAVMQLNAEDVGKRQFIMVQLPEVCDETSEAAKAGYKNICEIGKERIRRAGKKILDAATAQDQKGLLSPLQNEQKLPDVGFKVFKLDTSNLLKWDDTPLDSTETSDLFNRLNGMEKSLKKDRTDLDVVYEVMAKLGIPLTYKISEITLNNRKVYSIGDEGLILICLDGSNGGITPEDITAMCDLAPAKIVAAEEAFNDDVSLSNAYYISKDSGVAIELL